MYFFLFSDGDYRLQIRILVEVIHILGYFMFLFVCLVALCNLYLTRNYLITVYPRPVEWPLALEPIILTKTELGNEGTIFFYVKIIVFKIRGNT